MRAQFSFDDPDPRAVGSVRQQFAAAAAEWGLAPETAASATLVISELATNAVRHARTAFAVNVECNDMTLRIEVFDRDTRAPVAMNADADATGGRGLLLVAALAGNWGWQSAELDGITGKLVWAEFPL